MSEPQITHSAEPTTDLRGTIEAVLDRHTKIYGVNHFTEAVLEICSVCQREWPCDAHTLATALLEAVYFLDRIAVGLWITNTDSGPDRLAQEALTTIATKLEEADDAR